MTINPKYRTFFILSTAEILGLLLTKPKDLGLFFLTWVILTLVLLAYAVLQFYFPKKHKTEEQVKNHLTTLDDTVQPLESLTPPTLMAGLKTSKNCTTALLFLINLVLFILFK